MSLSIIKNCLFVAVLCTAQLYAANAHVSILGENRPLWETCQEVDAEIQVLAQKTQAMYEECLLKYYNLCMNVLKSVLDDLQTKGIAPDPVPRFFELSSPLTDIVSYKVYITYSHETPSIVARASFEIQRSSKAYFSWIIAPVIEISLPLQQPCNNLSQTYLDCDVLKNVLCHELGHLWRFDPFKVHHRLNSYLSHWQLCGVSFLLRHLIGWKSRWDEAQADIFAEQVSSIASLKKRSAMLVRSYILNALRDVMIICCNDNVLMRYMVRLQNMLQVNTHPDDRQRLKATIAAWEKLQARDLMATLNSLDALAVAHDQVAREYAEMIQSLREFDYNNLMEIISATYGLVPDLKKRVLIMQQLEVIKKQLLSLV